MEKRNKCRFHLIENFFVINEEQYQDYIYGVRKNVLYLVHYGFSREEVYFMPIGEMLDYIKIINNDNKMEQERVEAMERKTETASNFNDVKMAGNSTAFF